MARSTIAMPVAGNPISVADFGAKVKGNDEDHETRIAALEDNPLAGIVARQGGSATDWDMEGSTNYTPSTAKIQVGVIKISMSTYTAYADITFPEAFTNKPIVLTSLGKLNTGGYSNTQSFNVYADGITNTGCRINLEYSASSVTCGRNVYWIAIGD